MPKEIIKGFAILKKSAAKANFELGLLEEEKSNAIAHAADKVIAGELNEHFPLVVWQTGSGTQSNMNVNEVISYVGNEWLKEQNSELVLQQIEDEVLPAVKVLKESIAVKVEAFKDVVKIGRTHLQDATPITLGQEMSGWHRMLEKAEIMINESAEHLKDLAIGGTAVGTGLNA